MPGLRPGEARRQAECHGYGLDADRARAPLRWRAVPWDETNVKHPFVLELLDADGQPVMVPTDNGAQPLRMDGLEVGRPPGHKPDTPIGVPFATFQAGLQLEPGGRP